MAVTKEKIINGIIVFSVIMLIACVFASLGTCVDGVPTSSGYIVILMVFIMALFIFLLIIGEDYD